MVEGTWVDDVRDGIFVLTHNNTIVKRTQWEKGNFICDIDEGNSAIDKELREREETAKEETVKEEITKEEFMMNKSDQDENYEETTNEKNNKENIISENYD